MVMKLSSSRGGTGWIETPEMPGRSLAGSGRDFAVHDQAHPLALDQRVHHAGARASSRCTTRFRWPGAVTR